jgi:hypothetical protein
MTGKYFRPLTQDMGRADALATMTGTNGFSVQAVPVNSRYQCCKFGF